MYAAPVIEYNLPITVPLGSIIWRVEGGLIASDKKRG